MKPPRSWVARLVEILNWEPKRSRRRSGQQNDPNAIFDPAWDSKLEMWDEEKKAVQNELRDDVQLLLDLPPRPSDAELYPGTTPAEFWLAIVVDKIRVDLFFPFFDVERSTRFGPKPSFRLGDEYFLITSGPVPTGLREYPYWALGETLRSGDFSMLRRCPGCRKYFVTQRANKQTCTRKCSIAHQNRKRWANGAIGEYRKGKEGERREKAIELLDQGKLPRDVKRETGLSDKILEDLYRLVNK